MKQFNKNLLQIFRENSDISEVLSKTRSLIIENLEKDELAGYLFDFYGQKVGNFTHPDLPENLDNLYRSSYVKMLKELLEYNYEKFEDCKEFQNFSELRKKIGEEKAKDPEKYDPSGGWGDYIGF